MTYPAIPEAEHRYWMRRYVGECPVCGADQSYSVRVEGDKPESPSDRIEMLSTEECYDQCLEREAL